MDRDEEDKIRDSEIGYPGISSEIRHYEEAKLPSCFHCGSNETARVSIGLVGRSMTIAGRTKKMKLLANGPKPGTYFCRACDKYYD